MYSLRKVGQKWVKSGSKKHAIFDLLLSKRPIFDLPSGFPETYFRPTLHLFLFLGAWGLLGSVPPFDGSGELALLLLVLQHTGQRVNLLFLVDFLATAFMRWMPRLLSVKIACLRWFLLALLSQNSTSSFSNICFLGLNQPASFCSGLLRTGTPGVDSRRHMSSMPWRNIGKVFKYKTYRGTQEYDLQKEGGLFFIFAVLRTLFPCSKTSTWKLAHPWREPPEALLDHLSQDNMRILLANLSGMQDASVTFWGPPQNAERMHLQTVLVA